MSFAVQLFRQRIGNMYSSSGARKNTCALYLYSIQLVTCKWEFMKEISLSYCNSTIADLHISNLTLTNTQQEADHKQKRAILETTLIQQKPSDSGKKWPHP